MEVSMGKGDQRSRRGKIHRGTFGKRRPRKRTKLAARRKRESESGAPASKRR
ncbi:MAG TPA: 30S ribosomal protein THX [Thermoanaerobaculia bacterium]|nr:30S ribosomal protein THX [Thermoanaerobaculia bacterium]